MSGSGATCFALFERDADLASTNSTAQVDWPDYWRLATRLL
jgi:4-diphosphocytidyl-2-C-methyl-D-erythritol kinase